MRNELATQPPSTTLWAVSRLVRDRGGITFALCRSRSPMKSCQCSECNVSSVRYTWGFTLLVRDGWTLKHDSEFPESTARQWLCPACRTRSETVLRGLAKLSGAAPRSRQRPRNRLRVLLIDDEELVLRCTARLLGEFEVVTAQGPEAAVEVLEKDSDFDAVLSDVMMPRMTGPELYARCCVQFPHLTQRFVFASGNPEAARAHLVRAVTRVGAEANPPMLLAKPATRESLVLALHAAAAHGAPRSGTYSAVAVDLGQGGVTKYRG